MTNEQRIRGADAGVDWALLLTGYGEEALAEVKRNVLGPAQLERHRATGVVDAMYRVDYSLTHDEVST